MNDEAQVDTVFITAGATPEGPYGDVYKLTTCGEDFVWSKLITENFDPRYEHGAYTSNDGKKIIVFGGARLDKNLNDVQALNLETNSWTTVAVKGDQPCPRTSHSVAVLSNKMYVFGGGYSGAMPVTDTALYCFDMDIMTWTRLTTKGEPPLPRHGHVMAGIMGDIYVHGGMEGVELYDDLYKISLDSLTWERLSPNGEIPSGRAAHAGVVVKSGLFIFGGMGKGGALDDLYRFDSETQFWERLTAEGSPPSARLDHSLTAFRRKVKTRPQDEDNGKSNYEVETLLFVFGGMDTRGEIFSDCCVLRIEDC